MLQYPRFPPKFRVERVPPDQVFLLSDCDRFFLKSEVYYALAPLLTGRHQTDAIVARLPQFPATTLYYALMQLSQKGYLIEAGAEGAGAEETGVEEAWAEAEAPEKEQIIQEPPLATEQSNRVRVQVFVSDEAPTSLRQGLERLAQQLRQQLDQRLDQRLYQRPSWTQIPPIVLTDDYLHPQLATVNQTTLESDQPWLLVKPFGEELWIGPYFVPGQTGCWECLAQRLRGNRPMEQWLDSLTERETIQWPEPASDAASLTAVQEQILNWLDPSQGHLTELQGQLITVQFAPLFPNAPPSPNATSSKPPRQHRLVRRPQCLACGDGERLRSPQVLAQLPPTPSLSACPKQFTADGGHRSQPPAATLQQLMPQVSPITGVVRELRAVAVDGSTRDETSTETGTEANLDGSPEGDRPLLHTYITAHDSGEVSHNLEALKLNLQGRSAGKGKTKVQAKVSGICEAIERYSGIFQGDEPRIRASYQALCDGAGDGVADEAAIAIHPNQVMNFSRAQYANREDWNRHQTDLRHYVPEPFDPTAEIEWSPLWSLTEQRFKYLPTAFCYYGYSTPFCKANSNGCAAGNTLEEAILQGFLELVERDAVAIWWGNQLQRPAVSLESFNDPYFVELPQHYYDAYQRTLYVLDLTHDLGIPTVAAVSHLIEPEPMQDGRLDQKILCGFGAHFEGAIAISRALTEVNQLLTGSLNPNNRTSPNNRSSSHSPTTPARPPTVNQNVNQNVNQADNQVIPYEIHLSLVDQSHLMANPLLAPSDAQSMPSVRRNDLLEDVLACEEIVRRAGMEMLILDQTRPDIGLPVVRVVVPGMRHFWHRLGPGRLYTVPLQLQWLLKPRLEDRQNPLPFPF